MREVFVYWFCVEKNEKKNIADFHVLGLFMAKNMISANFFSVCHATGPLPLKDLES
jgi:hypothetical protein